jgi:pyridoxal/pyridoxine/pyridoxamine kinase
VLLAQALLAQAAQQVLLVLKAVMDKPPQLGIKEQLVSEVQEQLAQQGKLAQTEQMVLQD